MGNDPADDLLGKILREATRDIRLRRYMMEGFNEAFVFKRGSSFVADITLVDSTGAPAVIPVADMRSQIRFGETLLTTLVIATTAVPGTYRLTTADDTSAWTLGMSQLDVRTVVASVISYSYTITFRIIDQVTSVA